MISKFRKCGRLPQPGTPPPVVEMRKSNLKKLNTRARSPIDNKIYLSLQIMNDLINNIESAFRVVNGRLVKKLSALGQRAQITIIDF